VATAEATAAAATAAATVEAATAAAREAAATAAAATAAAREVEARAAAARVAVVKVVAVLGVVMVVEERARGREAVAGSAPHGLISVPPWHRLPTPYHLLFSFFLAERTVHPWRKNMQVTRPQQPSWMLELGAQAQLAERLQTAVGWKLELLQRTFPIARLPLQREEGGAHNPLARTAS